MGPNVVTANDQICRLTATDISENGKPKRPKTCLIYIFASLAFHTGNLKYIYFGLFLRSKEKTPTSTLIVGLFAKLFPPLIIN